MSQSTLAVRPEKPRPDFPLFPHGNGLWCKKVRGKLRYFGSVVKDPTGKAALEWWLKDKDDLLAGRTPRTDSNALTLHELCNRFLSAKEAQRDAGAIAHRSFVDYFETCQRILDAFGKTRLVEDLAADDFESLRASLAKRYGVCRLATEVQRVRTTFRYGYEAGLIDRPVRFGPTFVKPSARQMRQHRHERGPRLFTAAELREVLAACNQPVRAMVLLACNTGFGNHDVGTLPMSALDLDGQWVRFPRPKTGILRTCPLWPETVESIREAIELRPKPRRPEYDRYVFLTASGRPWSKDGSSTNPLSREFQKVLKRLGIYRRGLSFYVLRHVVETVGGEARDQVALDHIMGHCRNDMASVYREAISDDRLLAVVNHVRSWLWPEAVHDA